VKTKIFVTFIVAVYSLSGGESGPLKLRDGRSFEDWKIASSSALAVVIKYKGGLAQVPKALLPDPLRAEYPVDEALVAAERRDALESRKAAQARAAQLATARKLQREQAILPQQLNGLSGPTPNGESAILQLVSNAALNGAARYYKYEYDASARNRAWTVSVEVEPETPEQWAGFPGRYTVKGKVNIRYFDWYGSSSTRTATKEYTVIVDVINSTAKVVEVRTT
jgi:hypothetical protein